MSAAVTDPWVRRFHPNQDAAHRVLVLPHAGGSASYYFGFSRAMSAHADVLVAQYPGRQDRRGDELIDSVTGLADALLPVALRWADRPLTILGHSMGASVGFELAVRLQERGVGVHGLVASGRRAPSTRRDERVHQRDDAGLIEEMKRLDGTVGDLLDDRDLLDMILPPLRNDYRAAETYRWESGPALTAPIIALTGDSDPRTSLEEVDRWAHHTTVGCSVEVYSGGHFFLNDHMDAIVERLRAHIG